MPIARDPRWVLLAEPGEYSTLGRHREPDDEAIAAAEAALAKARPRRLNCCHEPFGTREDCGRDGDGPTSVRTKHIVRSCRSGVPSQGRIIFRAK